jgi:hypothetical protein
MSDPGRLLSELLDRCRSVRISRTETGKVSETLVEVQLRTGVEWEVRSEVDLGLARISDVDERAVSVRQAIALMAEHLG